MEEQEVVMTTMDNLLEDLAVIGDEFPLLDADDIDAEKIKQLEDVRDRFIHLVAAIVAEYEK